ncbi:MAG: dephospho-CoA kinase [candidate division KSB1 bacterium]|nr:dephospho-CoA kinase [candidate division KSB1 bacterium]
MEPPASGGIVVGLTGGIGSGKSVVARLLRRYGLPVIDADAVGHQLTAHDETVRAALRQTFGERVFGPDGRLLREQLACIVFSDADARQCLNRIIHPPMRRCIDAHVQSLLESGHRIVVVDGALLGEADLVGHLDALVVVYAPLKERIARIRQRNGLPDEEILRRIAAQMPLEEKLRLADYVVYNTGSIWALRKEVRVLHAWLQERVRRTLGSRCPDS